MIVSLSGQKGGSGKTTTAEAIASEMMTRGRSVFVVDADPQGTMKTWADVAAENGHECPKVVMMGPKVMMQQVPALEPQYDLILIDTPSKHAELQRVALMLADVALFPCSPTAHDTWGMTESVELFKEAEKLRPGLRAFLLINRKRAQTRIGKGARASLSSLEVPILTAELHLRSAYEEAPAAGLGPAQYARPSDEAVTEVRALVDELLEVMNGKGKANNRATKAKARRA